MNYGVGGVDRIPIYREDVCRAVIEPVTLLERDRNGVQSTITGEANGTGIGAFVTSLRPVNEGVACRDDRFGRYYHLGRILTVVAQLIVYRSVGKCKRKETPFGAAIIQGDRARRGSHEIGSGVIVSTSTRRQRIPVMQILAPPSMSEGLSAAASAVASRVTHATISFSHLRPQTRGRLTTHVTLSIGSKGKRSISICGTA